MVFYDVSMAIVAAAFFSFTLFFVLSFFYFCSYASLASLSIFSLSNSTYTKVVSGQEPDAMRTAGQREHLLLGRRALFPIYMVGLFVLWWIETRGGEGVKGAVLVWLNRYTPDWPRHFSTLLIFYTACNNMRKHHIFCRMCRQFVAPGRPYGVWLYGRRMVRRTIPTVLRPPLAK